uniref:Flavin-containing monooxygenase n=1 Tax=Leersia perrieri TaxID=77586 RepID=A0A0D9WUR5_9ORYZ
MVFDDGVVADGETPEQWKKKKNVCVIGAGMSGLAAARELRREGHAVTVLEQAGDIGGQWLYTDDAGDGDGDTPAASVHSSMYASLRLISPRESMGFTDFPFFPVSGDGRDPRRFPGHREVFLYLNDFCHAFRLLDAVRFNTKVIHVAAMAGDGGERNWAVRSVRVVDGGDGDVEEVFDAVVVATGHYSQPKLPRIKGMESWKRRQLHSHCYRRPEKFRGEVIVVVGAGDSGKDIAIELTGVAKSVHLAATDRDAAMSPAMRKLLAKHTNLHLRPRVEHLGDDGAVVFDGGERVVADTVMYCTGYVYSFPFLDTGDEVAVDEDGSRVGPLFEHVFPPALAPSLSFVGVPKKVPAPWFFEAQGKWIAMVLSGKKSLPSPEKMMIAVEEQYRARAVAGVPVKCTHELGGVEPQKYIEFGEKYCDFPRFEDWKREIIVSALKKRDDDDMETFRDRVDDDSDYVRLCLQNWYSSSPAQDQRLSVDDDDAHPPLAQTAMAALALN